MNRLSAVRAAALRGTLWPAVLAALVGIGLLVAFHQVVQGAVDQAVQRRQAAALLADTDWRCRPAIHSVRRVAFAAAAPAAEGRQGCPPTP